MRAWEEFLHKQDLEMGKQTVDKWLRSLKIVCFDACNLYLEAKDSFYALWFEEHVRHKVKKDFFNNNNKLIKVHLSIVKSQKKEDLLINKNRINSNDEQFIVKLPKDSSKMHFDSFITCPGNEFAWRLLKEVVLEVINVNKQDRTLNFNPIYLFGPSGSGKTHLMMASMNLLKNSGKKVIYVETSSFTEHVVSAIRRSEMEKFRAIYRNIDAFFIDNIDILSGKTATQEEFFHTFNALHLEGKLIVIASLYNPQILENIEHRLTSRFEWGIVVPIQSLDENGVEVLVNRYIKDKGISFTKEAILFLHKTFNGSFKEIIKILENFLIRLSNISLFSNIINEKVLKEVLNDLILLEEVNQITPDKIVQRVSDYYGVRIEDILGKSQSKDCVFPRQVAMYLCRENLGMPYVKIGHIFSRDHSTVMSSIKQINSILNKVDSDLVFSIKKIKESL